MHGLRQRHEDGGDAQLPVREVLYNVRVKSEDAELVRSHDTGQELHEQDFVVQRETFVVAVEDVVQFFAKGLGVIEELQAGEIRRGLRLVILFLEYK
jgi:hypothetical protein